MQRFELQPQPALVVAEHQPVAQVVKGELLVGAVDHVRAVAAAPGRRVHIRGDRPDGKAQGLVDGAHLPGIALHQVVVDRDHVHRQAGQGGGGRGQGGGEGFALAGLHLGQAAMGQHPAAGQLRVVMAQADGAAGGLAHQGKGADQQVVGKAAPMQVQAQQTGLFSEPGGVKLGEAAALLVDGIERAAGGPARPGELRQAGERVQGGVQKVFGVGRSLRVGATGQARPDRHAVRPGTGVRHGSGAGTAGAGRGTTGGRAARSRGRRARGRARRCAPARWPGAG